MTNLIIEVPDDLARSLESIAAAQRKSLQQLALERRLRWLGDHSLVFDRIRDDILAIHARIWKVAVQ